MSRSKVESVLLKAVKERFGSDADVLEIRLSDAKGQDQYASSVAFVGAKLKRQDVIKEVDVVIKMLHENVEYRELSKSDTQFYNEVYAYKELLPFLNRGDIVEEIFAEFLYGHASCGERPADDAVVVEDLRSSGYRLTTERLLLDYDHCVLAVTQLGRFHALSYAAKERNFSLFIDKVSALKEVHYADGNGDLVNKFLLSGVRRGITPLLERDEYKEVLRRFDRLLDDPFALMKSLFTPEEPIAVLCHGDFCRNNVLYKYEHGKPIGVKFFDLGTSRYSSPAIDLGFFFCLNVPSEIRKERWNDLLAVYRESLSSAVPGIRVPTLDDLKREMRRKAVYGYVICSFFLPIMMDVTVADAEGYIGLSEEEKLELSRSAGGDTATQAVVALVEDLILHECL